MNSIPSRKPECKFGDIHNFSLNICVKVKINAKFSSGTYLEIFR